jgi:WD40 repeat protein
LFATDAPLLATIADDGVERIHDWQAGRTVREIKIGPLPTAIVGFGPGGAQLLLASQDESSARLQLRAWSVAGSGEAPSWPVALANATRFTLSPDGRRVALRAGDGSQSVLDLTTGVEQRLPPATWASSGPGFSIDGRLLALPSTVGWVKIWDVDHASQLAELSGFVLGVHSAGFSPDDRRIVAGSGGAEALSLWDAKSFEPLLTLPAEGSIFGGAAFSRDGARIGARNALGQLHLWSAPAAAEIEVAEAAGGR